MDEVNIASEKIRKVTIAATIFAEEKPRPLKWNIEKISSLSKLFKLRRDPKDRLIRVTGRMELAIREQTPDPPILLPPNNKIVDLLIRNCHIRLSHAGVKTTHSELRETYWIVRGRQQVKRVLHRCIPCNRLQSRPYNELASPIPIERVRKARPFDQCGVDFAGPIYHKPYKYDAHGELATPTPADQGAPPPPGEGPPRKSNSPRQQHRRWLIPDRQKQFNRFSPHPVRRKNWYAKSLHLPLYLRLH
jgi:hypothetical protein